MLGGLEADAWLERADHSLDRRELGSVCGAFDAAEYCGAEPDRCSAGRWLAAMLGGDFAAAWRESDTIRRRGGNDPHRFWDGEDLHGRRVIVRCLHGFGDAVQMLRFAPLLHGVAASVVFEVPPRLVPLAPFFCGVQQVITWGEGAPPLPPAWDAQVEIMELPYIFRITLQDLPVAERYLELPPAFVAEVASAMPLKERLRVGIVWAGGEWNPGRSIPFAALEPLLRMKNVEFWSLQEDPACSSTEGCSLLHAKSITGDGLLPLAATIANLDLVITVDTLAAHLAGALGKPAWVMLQYAADWRWMTERENSPWYASLRLFRQHAEGDWDGVVGRVREALKILAR